MFCVCSIFDLNEVYRFIIKIFLIYDNFHVYSLIPVSLDNHNQAPSRILLRIAGCHIHGVVWSLFNHALMKPLYNIHLLVSDDLLLIEAVIMHERSEIEKYSHSFVIICNFPGEEYAGKVEKKILQGFVDKWKSVHHDPEAERIHFIYLHKNDSASMSKFQVLQLADHRSRIYIIGHCKPGADAIRSDAIYPVRNGKIKKKMYAQHEFSYVDIGMILLHNITNPEVLLSRESTQDYFSLYSMNQRLRICVPSCFSGVDLTDKQGKVVEASFAFKLMNFLVNGSDSKMLKCDIVASRGFVNPVPAHPSLSKFISFVLDSESRLSSQQSGFHKRYTLVKNYESMTLFPRHKPDVDYKWTFIISPEAGYAEFTSGRIRISALSKKDGANRHIQQVRSEFMLNHVNSINDSEYPEEQVLLAENIKTAITTGVFLHSHVEKLYELLEESDIPKLLRSG